MGGHQQRHAGDGGHLLQHVAELLLCAGVKEGFGLLQREHHAAAGVGGQVAQHGHQQAATHTGALPLQRSGDKVVDCDAHVGQGGLDAGHIWGQANAVDLRKQATHFGG